MRRWQPAYVAIGSNLSDPADQVRKALGHLAGIADTRLLAHSRLWASRPLGPVEQPDFVNAAAAVLTRLEARRLLGALQAIEVAMGRRTPGVHWGPRVIDLDLLVYGSAAVDEPGLTLPHAGVHERDFVLYPLAEIAPGLWIPGRGRVATLAGRVANRGLVVLAE